MKKVIASVILLAMVVTVFVGCQTSQVEATDPNVLTNVSLSQETKDAIDKAVLALGSAKIDWDFAKYYYGTINGCVIVNNDSYAVTHPSALWETKVGNLTFSWGHPIEIYVFKDGEAHALADAYNKGWLKDTHILQIYECHEEFRTNYVKYFMEWSAAQGS